MGLACALREIALALARERDRCRFSGASGRAAGGRVKGWLNAPLRRELEGNHHP